MARVFFALAATGALLATTSCSFVEGTSGTFNAFGCSGYSKKIIGAANWDTARAVNMRVRQGEYWPMVVTLTAQRPYVLRIANDDPQNRVFRAGAFFEAAAVGLVRIDGEIQPHRCLSSVTVGADSTAEIWFIAMKDGRYEFEDQAIPYFFSQGASGVIRVSYARTRHVSPVSQLIVPDEVPTAPIVAPRASAPASSPSPPARKAPQPPPPQAAPPAAVTPAPIETPEKTPGAPDSSGKGAPPAEPAPPRQSNRRTHPDRIGYRTVARGF